MMRHLTDEERKLTEKLHSGTLTEEEKNQIIERLKQIDDEQNKDCPFTH